MNYHSIVVLTGAGVSAESGIDTFRAQNGLWENHRIQDVATYEGFASNPTRVHDFYNARRQKLLSAEIQPNAAHLNLAQLEQNFAGSFLLVTQNIDNLHTRAGSKKVLHMHGELLKIRCEQSGRVLDCQEDVFTRSVCACCHQPNNLRPHVVWFGEMPLGMSKIEQHLNHCDLFIAIGTSAQVYPAAGFVDLAHNAQTVELNLKPSAAESKFQQKVYGLASQIVPEFLTQKGLL